MNGRLHTSEEEFQESREVTHGAILEPNADTRPAIPSSPKIAQSSSERVHSEQTHITVACVGAGAAGLITAYQAKKYLKDYTLTVYEKNNDIGGTWYENTYPGVGCDVPSHAYTFGFEGSTEWDGFYPVGAQVQKYLENFSAKNDLRKHVRFETTVEHARWIDDIGQWELDLVKKDGTREKAWAQVLINGTGPLNKWKWPKIEGLHDFKGTLVHTARWDANIDWQGKRVGVIGNGSSGIQVTPQLAKGAAHLTVFAKSQQWIVPPVAWQDIRVIPDSPHSAMPAPAGKHVYSDVEKEVMNDQPDRFLQYRKAVDGAQNERYSVFLRNHPAHDMINGMVREMVEARLGTEEAEWKELYRPKFSIGCKRPTPGDEFLETLRQPHVSSVVSPISRITSTGVETSDGKVHELDILVCATGFDVGFAPHFQVTGLHGRKMEQEWEDAPQCYLSVASPNFPNFFFIGGPTGNWSQGCVLVSHEVQAEYAMQAAAKISIENLHSVHPRPETTRQWVDHLNSWHKKFSVFSENCDSWMKYKGSIQLWPGSFFNMLHTIRQPRWEDYEIVRRGSNMWSYLGDGRTERELLKEKGVDVDMAPYMRASDTPWSIDV